MENKLIGISNNAIHSLHKVNQEMLQEREGSPEVGSTHGFALQSDPG